MIAQVAQLAGALVAIPAVLLAVIASGEAAVHRLPARRHAMIRPWVWMAPMLMLVGLVVAYPLASTLVLSLRGADGAAWAGLQNFAWAFSTALRPVLVNNILWIVLFPAVTAGLALLAAVLLDHVGYERLARTFLVLPTAMSFVAGSVIWRMMYEYQPPFLDQTGTLNALLALWPGAQPIAWLLDPLVNNYALIFVAVWMSLGVATLILSAGVKTIPRELVESARLDGAGEAGIFRYITLPALWPTILVVVTTEAIFTLKVFDIVYVMTNGAFDTDVIANKMYSELFVSQHLGHASAIAVLLMLMAAPVVVMNVRQMRAEAR